MSSFMITSVSWNPRGHAKPVPIMSDLQKTDMGIDAPVQNPQAGPSRSNDMNEDDVVKEYGLENYDEEEDNGAWTGGKGLTFHQTNEEDPHLTRKDVDDDDLEDFVIRETDDVILSAVMEQSEWSHLDVCILPAGEDSQLYVHHDYVLPAFPLCVAWIPPNLAAVGSFNPEIELWDLNIVDTPEPDAKLVGHTDAILGLAAHPVHTQMLASASADCTVKLWDITSGQVVLNMDHHKAKVQSVAWSPSDCNAEYQGLLATGAFDQKVCIVDVTSHTNVKEIQLDADVECIRWYNDRAGNPLLFISAENGDVMCYDVKAGMRRWTLSAHTGVACSSISLFRPPEGGPTLLATAAPDTKTPLKLWTIPDGRGPTCIYSKTSGLGRLHSVAFAPQRPFFLALGGHTRQPEIFNILELAEVQRAFNGVNLAFPNIAESLHSKTSVSADGDSDDEQPPPAHGSNRSHGGMDIDEDGEPIQTRQKTRAQMVRTPQVAAFLKQINKNKAGKKRK